MDVDSYFICETLDFNLRNACCIQVLLNELTNVVIFYQRIAEVRLIRKPAGIPIFNDADTETVRINLLAHNSTSWDYSSSFRTMVMCEVLFKMR